MSTVRPIVSEADLGSAGWRALHLDARQYGRRPTGQLLAYLRYAVKQRLEGRNTELSPAQLDRLLGREPETAA